MTGYGLQAAGCRHRRATGLSAEGPVSRQPVSLQPEPCPDAPTSKRILVIGSGPIVIGQSSEFDYSGTQACKALKAEGLEVVLINSNPATIMTDPEFADRTYVEPLTTGDRRRRSSRRSGPTPCCRPSADRPR